MRNTKAKEIRRVLAFSTGTHPRSMGTLERWQYRQTKSIYNDLPRTSSRAIFLDEVDPIKKRLIAKLVSIFPPAIPAKGGNTDASSQPSTPPIP